MRTIRRRAHARAGLIGNPSDGYGGKTIAFAIESFAAEVVMYPWEEVEIIWSEQDKNRFETVEDLVEDVNLNGYYGGVRLVKATIKRFVEFCRERSIELSKQPFSVRYQTNIPRGVGLAGSSAIVVATLRCLLEFYEISLPLTLQSSLARSVENDELDIACGYQDRVAQVYDGLVYMDFSDMQDDGDLQFGSYQYVDVSKLAPLYVAYDLSASKTSASIHGPLRTRLRDNARLSETMDEIAALVPLARKAIEAGDTEQLASLIDRNFDLRQKLYSIQSDHLAMIETARTVGASAKFAGSGGAIVGTYRDDQMFAELEQALTARSKDWRLVRPNLVPPAPTKSTP